MGEYESADRDATAPLARAVVPIESLLPADSPRSQGEDEAHVVRLAEVDAQLPPVVVHRDTMRVIDGMHRVRAAKLNGATTIEVEFFDGSAHEAFLLGVKLNVAHGLPLSFADRKAAVRRILDGSPSLSNRAVAAITGLSSKTVASIRQGVADPSSERRLGSDGRQRPLDAEAGRRRAADLLALDPALSVRQLAARAGVSLGTAHDVRKRVRAGKEPTRRRREPRRSAEEDPRAMLQALSRDPALRFSTPGKRMLRWLHDKSLDRSEWLGLIAALPPHCLPLIGKLARHYEEQWHAVARHVDDHVESSRCQSLPTSKTTEH
jgi:ParB-like chromosome segregation protein Spo0J